MQHKASSRDYGITINVHKTPNLKKNAAISFSVERVVAKNSSSSKHSSRQVVDLRSGTCHCCKREIFTCGPRSVGVQKRSRRTARRQRHSRHKWVEIRGAKRRLWSEANAEVFRGCSQVAGVLRSTLMATVSENAPSPRPLREVHTDSAALYCHFSFPPQWQKKCI